MFPLSPRVLHSWFPCICIIQEKEGFGKAYLIQSLNIISDGDKKAETQGQRQSPPQLGRAGCHAARDLGGYVGP